MRYKVSFDKAMEVCADSPDFLMQLKSGSYIYVDSYFCLNQPKYISWDKTIATMTAYARGHKSECCLPVSTETVREQACKIKETRENIEKIKENIEVPSFRVVATTTTTPKPKPKPKFKPKPRPPIEEKNTRLEQQIDLFSKIMEETKEIAKELSPNLSKTVKALMKWRHITVEKLAEASKMSPKTIQRLRKDPPETEPALDSLVQLCIGLHLPPTLSEYVLRAAGKSFTDRDLHTAYRLLLTSCYEYSIEDCNILLESQGLPLLRDRDALQTA